MKIVTWNVNGLRSVAQKGFHQFWESEDPDCFCLQETKCHPDQLGDHFAAPEGYNSFWSAAQRPGYSGTVTFCKRLPTEVRHGIGIPKFDAEGRMVITKIDDLWLYNCYFPNGGSGEERHRFKQEYLKRFASHLRAKLKAGEKVIVVGDYNVAYLDIDVYDPKALSAESGFLPEEREWMAEFLESGFIDTYRYFHPKEANKYTWWAYYQNARVTNRGWRIDHICVSRNLEKRLRSVEILDGIEGSDHCPVRLEME
jgi:exodeoxyribonuclease-3